MRDTTKRTRRFEINGIKITVRPTYSMNGYFEGYSVSGYDTTQFYPAYLNGRFNHFEPYGNDEERTCREIAENFLEYHLPSTRISGD